MVGVDKKTLLRWLYSGHLKEPRRIGNGGVTIRIWTDRGVARVRKYKEKNYRKGRGRKVKAKRKS